VALVRNTRADKDLQLATALGNLAGRYNELGRLKDAKLTYSEALEVEEELLSPDDPSLAITRSNLAQLYASEKNYDVAEPLLRSTLEVMSVKYGTSSAEYGHAISDIGTLYLYWSHEPGQRARLEKAAKYCCEGLAITQKVRGERHPETASRLHNLAGTTSSAGDWPGAAVNAERAVAIMLSLDLAQHPNTQGMAGHLAHCWEQSGQADKAARLRRGDISDLVLVIAQIELEHRAWVAADPQNRHFGPDSYFAPNEENLESIFKMFAAAGVDVDDLMRRIKAGQISSDEIAKLVAETIVNKKD